MRCYANYKVSHANIYIYIYCKSITFLKSIYIQVEIILYSQKIFLQHFTLKCKFDTNF